MKVEIIKERKLKFKPNMEEYNKMRKKFTWKHAEKEIEFFPGKKLNIAYNSVDRHAKSWRKNKVALIYEKEDGSDLKYTFNDIFLLSNRFANLLKSIGIQKGEKVFIFLPRTPESYITFIGTLKTGAVVGSLFEAFGPIALKDRLENSEAKVLVTNSELKHRVYEIEKELPNLKYLVITDNNTEEGHPFKEIAYGDIYKQPDSFKTIPMNPDDPSFMLYTSGTTGKPKGVIHGHKAIIVQHITAKYILDLKEEDLLWCTADLGWVTGISYGILGSWSNGATLFALQGRFDPEKWYKAIEKYKVTVWYTAPTAIRMLEKAGELYKKYDFSSLRHLCSVGEPLNPYPIKWGIEAFKLPFHDTWWQTETGGILISNYPNMPIKLGSMGKPFPGIEAGIIDEKGNEAKPNEIGRLALRPGWPSMMMEIFKRPEKYESYFIKGKKGKWYVSGDMAFKDKDGYFWFVGRDDDVIKTCGERVGPFEVESALVEHPAVIEAGVIGKPDPLRGEIIKAFVILKDNFQESEELKADIQNFVKKKLAGHAYPREIEIVKTLPKTRSGKIARRVLKAKELGIEVGDTSTIENY